MAPFVPVPNVVKAVIQGTMSGSPWAHVLHYQYTGGPPSSASLQAGSSVLFNQWNTHMGSQLSIAVLTTEASLVDLSSDLGASGATGGSVAGILGGAPAPNQVAFLISKHILRHYRGGHPRAYLPLGDAQLLATPTSWASTFVTAATSAYTQFIQATANGGMWASVGAEVTVHRLRNHQPIVPPVVDIVQSYTGQSTVATQRRRVGR